MDAEDIYEAASRAAEVSNWLYRVKDSLFTQAGAAQDGAEVSPEAASLVALVNKLWAFAEGAANAEAAEVLLFIQALELGAAAMGGEDNPIEVAMGALPHKIAVAVDTDLFVEAFDAWTDSSSTRPENKGEAVRRAMKSANLTPPSADSIKRYGRRLRSQRIG